MWQVLHLTLSTRVALLRAQMSKVDEEGPWNVGEIKWTKAGTPDKRTTLGKFLAGKGIKKDDADADGVIRLLEDGLKRLTIIDPPSPKSTGGGSSPFPEDDHFRRAQGLILAITRIRELYVGATGGTVEKRNKDRKLGHVMVLAEGLAHSTAVKLEKNLIAWASTEFPDKIRNSSSGGELARGKESYSVYLNYS